MNVVRKEKRSGWALRHSDFVIPWVFGYFVIRHLWRVFILFCLAQTRLTKRHSAVVPCSQCAAWSAWALSTQQRQKG